MPDIRISIETWAMAKAFRIARGMCEEAVVVVVELTDGPFQGRGEACPTEHYGESVESVRQQLEEIRPLVVGGLDRWAMQSLLPPGSARNALDCAYWDLAAKQSGVPVWELAAAPMPQPLQTAYTLSLESPEEMAAVARVEAGRGLLKLKLGAEGDMERVEAVRRAAPDVRLIVDANEAWTFDELREYVDVLHGLGVELVEQPLPASGDGALEGYVSPVPLCADESCHVAADIERIANRYSFVNIKLDKTGGLTEALELVQRARAARMRLMIGCMAGTSLAMAPGLIIAGFCEVIDLDAPQLLARDRDHGLHYDGGIVGPAEGRLWG